MSYHIQLVRFEFTIIYKAHQLSWLERRANNAKVTGSIPLWANILSVFQPIFVHMQIINTALYKKKMPKLKSASQRHCYNGKFLRNIQSKIAHRIFKFNYVADLGASFRHQSEWMQVQIAQLSGISFLPSSKFCYNFQIFCLCKSTI